MKRKLIIGLAVIQLMLYIFDVGTQLMYVHKTQGIARAGREAGEYIRTHYPKNSKLAVYFDAGMVPYITKMQTLDLCGLLNKDIAMNDYTYRHKYEDKKFYSVNGQMTEGWLINVRNVFDYKLNYLFAYHPDVMVINSKAEIELKEDAFTNCLMADPRFREYQFVKSFKENSYFYIIYEHRR